MDEKTQQHLNVWERDFHFGILIEDVLKKPDPKHAYQVLNIIKQGLKVPDSFKAPAVNKEEIDELTKEIESLRIKNHDYETKLRNLECLNETNIKNLNKVNADYEALNKKSEKDLADIKSEYEKKITELVWKNNNLIEEKELRELELKKYQENSIIVNKENEKENQKTDKTQKILLEIARLEGRLLNKEKELKTAWEKVEFYRSQLK